MIALIVLNRVIVCLHIYSMLCYYFNVHAKVFPSQSNEEEK